MFSIGFLKISLIIILAIILLKPEDWPQLLRQIGRLVKKAQIFSHHLQRSFDAAIHESDSYKLNKDPCSSSKSSHSKNPPSS